MTWARLRCKAASYVNTGTVWRVCDGKAGRTERFMGTPVAGMG